MVLDDDSPAASTATGERPESTGSGRAGLTRTGAEVLLRDLWSIHGRVLHADEGVDVAVDEADLDLGPDREHVALPQVERGAAVVDGGRVRDGDGHALDDADAGRVLPVAHDARSEEHT